MLYQRHRVLILTYAFFVKSHASNLQTQTRRLQVNSFRTLVLPDTYTNTHRTRTEKDNWIAHDLVGDRTNERVENPAAGVSARAFTAAGTVPERVGHLSFRAD